MWLIEGIFSWLFLAVAIAGLVTLGKSYRVRRGRRDNMLALNMREGCIWGLVASAILLSGGLLVAWLGS